jgi:hypothetical protein
MNIITSYSTKQDINAAVEEIIKGFEGFQPRAVIYFASSNFDPRVLSSAMQTAFKQITVLGCTTAGEIVTGKMLDNSIVAMGFNNSIIEDVKVEVLQNIKAAPGEAVENAFKAFENHYGMPMSEIDPTQYVGIILVDGLSGAEERLMERIGDLTNVSFIGGSAGDDLKFKQTHVFANGNAHSNAALLALIKTAVPFDFIKTQSFRPTDKILTATKVEESSREVIEFNDKPAIEAYAAAVGATVDKSSEFFMSNPVGLMIGDEPFVRSPQQVKGKSMLFFCNVHEGTDLTVLQAGDIVEDTRSALSAKQKEFGPFSGIINFNCILRTLELKQKNLTEAYGQLFTGWPTIGFSTYGEEFVGHINQTATILVFK